MLTKLPRDILLQDIFALLDHKALLNLSQVSTYFYSLVNDEHIWKRLCLREFNISQDNAFRNQGWKQFYIKMVHAKVFVWGENRDQRLGLNQPEATDFNIRIRGGRHVPGNRVNIPTELTALDDKRIVDIVTGGWSFHALDRSGSVWMWGTMNQESHQRSLSTKKLLRPTKLQQQQVLFKSISSGRTHVIGLARDGNAWHWTNHLLIQPISLDLDVGDSIVQVAANWSYSSLLTQQGKLYIIPLPDNIVSEEEASHPPPATRIDSPAISTEDKIVQIAGLDNYTMALTHSGRVLKLGTGDPHHLALNMDTMVLDLTNFGGLHEQNEREGVMKRFITGAFDNFAVYTTNQVLLGNVDATATSQPNILPGLQNKGIVKVSFGDYHTGAVTNDGQLLTWGNYSQGALGHGTMNQNQSLNTPTRVVEGGLKDMFVFAIGFGGWQSSVLAIPNNI